MSQLILTSSNNYVTNDFVKYLPKDPRQMNLIFIPTAAEVEPGDKKWLAADRQALKDAGFSVRDYSLTNQSPSEVQKNLAGADMIFVSGGNTFFLLQEMKKSGFGQLMPELLKLGVIYGGSSAGSIVAGPDIELSGMVDDPSLAPDLPNTQGLNLTDVVIIPHWGSDTFKKSMLARMEMAYRKGHKIIVLTDDQYVLVENGRYEIKSI
jgi:dipeptidase E